MSYINASDRSHYTQHVVQFFTTEHLSEDLRPVAEIFCATVVDLLEEVPSDGIEFTAGLRKLLEAKDCFVRHMVTLRPEEGGDDA